MRNMLFNDGKYDYLIVGAGFAGSTIARILAESRNMKVLIIERRPHIGGNAYDFLDQHGVRIHKYGPHIFHTNNLEVVRFLSRFTDWRFYEHRVLANVDAKLVPIPINQTTINNLYSANLDEDGVMNHFEKVKVRLDEVRNSEDVIISQVGYDLYEKFFKYYTYKQWNMWPAELKPEVCMRIPVRTNNDDRYFNDAYQMMPLDGYTKLFEKMLDHPNIDIMMKTPFPSVRDSLDYKHLVYTGSIDEYFEYKYGKLPYRSVEFEYETFNMKRYQTVGTVNYPSPDVLFTRITEYKHMTGQDLDMTTIAREYPTSEGEPYYVIPHDGAIDLYNKYKADALEQRNVSFVGRLAEYRYFNMDQVVARALELANAISS